MEIFYRRLLILTYKGNLTIHIRVNKITDFYAQRGVNLFNFDILKSCYSDNLNEKCN